MSTSHISMVQVDQIWSKSTVLEASLLHWTIQALQGNEQGRPLLGCYVEILRTRSGAISQLSSSTTLSR